MRGVKGMKIDTDAIHYHFRACSRPGQSHGLSLFHA